MKEKYIEKFVIIGENIKKARLNNNWSQENLADRCDNVNAAKISKIENAREDYYVATLFDVCEALKLDFSSILIKNEQPDK